MKRQLDENRSLDDQTDTTTTGDTRPTTTTTVDAASAAANGASRDRRKTAWSQSRQATILDFDAEGLCLPRA